MTHGQRLKVLGAVITFCRSSSCGNTYSFSRRTSAERPGQRRGITHPYWFQNCASPAKFARKEPGIGRTRQLHCERSSRLRWLPYRRRAPELQLRQWPEPLLSRCRAPRKDRPGDVSGRRLALRSSWDSNWAQRVRWPKHSQPKLDARQEWATRRRPHT